jgi:type IV secretory pathway VirB10-like protein
MAIDAPDTPPPARVHSAWTKGVGELPPQAKLAIVLTVCFLVLWMVLQLTPTPPPQAVASTATDSKPITTDDRQSREAALQMQKDLQAAAAQADRAVKSAAEAQAQRERDGITADQPDGSARSTPGRGAATSSTATAEEPRTVTPGRINHRAPAATPGNLAAANWLQNALGATPVRAITPTPVAAVAPGPGASTAPVTTLTATTVEEGRIIETVLENRLNGTAAGPVRVRVRVPVYGYDGSTLLVPQGATILGTASPVASVYDSRMTVAFHSLQMPPPNGRVYSLNQFKGLSQIGDIGLRDQVNNHYWSIFGASAAVGLVTGVAQWATAGRGGNNNVILGGFGQEGQQTANIVLQRFVNRPPDLVERPGDRVSVHVTNNLELPPWGR